MSKEKTKPLTVHARGAGAGAKLPLWLAGASNLSCPAFLAAPLAR